MCQVLDDGLSLSASVAVNEQILKVILMNATLMAYYINTRPARCEISTNQQLFEGTQGSCLTLLYLTGSF